MMRRSTFTGCVADAVDHPLLQGPQQLGLEPDVHLGDFAEQERAGLPSNLPMRRAMAPVKAPFMAEQLRFQQIVWDGQLTATKGCPCAASCGCRCWAIISLPVPPAGDEHGCIRTGDLLASRRRAPSPDRARSGSTCRLRPRRARRRSAPDRAAAAHIRARRPGWRRRPRARRSRCRRRPAA